MQGARNQAAAVVLGFALFAAGGSFPEKRQQIRRLREQKAELKREVESMWERLELLPARTILCAGAFSNGCGNGPRPASPWEYLKR